MIELIGSILSGLILFLPQRRYISEKEHNQILTEKQNFNMNRSFPLVYYKTEFLSTYSSQKNIKNLANCSLLLVNCQVVVPYALPTHNRINLQNAYHKIKVDQQQSIHFKNQLISSKITDNDLQLTSKIIMSNKEDDKLKELNEKIKTGEISLSTMGLDISGGGHIDDALLAICSAWITYMILQGVITEASALIPPNQFPRFAENQNYHQFQSSSARAGENQIIPQRDGTVSRQSTVQINQFINDDEINFDRAYEELQRRIATTGYKCTKEDFISFCHRPTRVDYQSEGSNIVMVCDKIGVRESITCFELRAHGIIPDFRRPTIEEYQTNESDAIFKTPTDEGFTNVEFKNTVSQTALRNEGKRANMHNHGRNVIKKCIWQKNSWDRPETKTKTLFVIDGYDTNTEEKKQVLEGIYSGAKVSNSDPETLKTERSVILHNFNI